MFAVNWRNTRKNMYMRCIIMTNGWTYIIYRSEKMSRNIEGQKEGLLYTTYVYMDLVPAKVIPYLHTSNIYNLI